MYRIAGSFLSLIVAAACCNLPAYALDPPDASARAADSMVAHDAVAICEIGADIERPMLLAAYTGESPKVAAEAPPTEPGASDSENSGAGAAPPDTVISLMQPGPRPPQVAARTVDDEKQPEDWIRTAESTTPEPGLWAMLIAGFLGVCAMARRRISSS